MWRAAFEARFSARALDDLSRAQVREFVFLVKLFNLKDNKAAALLLDFCRLDVKSSRDRVKVLWLGERALTSLDADGKKSLKVCAARSLAARVVSDA